jgi:hypothetical protein
MAARLGYASLIPARVSIIKIFSTASMNCRHGSTTMARSLATVPGQHLASEPALAEVSCQACGRMFKVALTEAFTSKRLGFSDEIRLDGCTTATQAPCGRARGIPGLFIHANFTRRDGS